MKILKGLFLSTLLINVNLFSSNLKITEELSSITVEHKGRDIIIKRVQKPNITLSSSIINSKKKCPTDCIQPMNIEDVKSIGELEVLNFIKDMQDNNDLLLIDIRSREWYKKGSIPTAINVPYTMLKKDSKYINKILKLLGAKKDGAKWDFTNAQTLLIFGNSSWDATATTVIKNLISIGYPQDRLKYYRGGILMWNLSGLTMIK